MKSSDFEVGQLVEFNNSANTRRTRGRVLCRDPQDPDRLLIDPVKKRKGAEPVSLDPEGAAIKPLEA